MLYIFLLVAFKQMEWDSDAEDQLGNPETGLPMTPGRDLGSSDDGEVLRLDVSEEEMEGVLSVDQAKLKKMKKNKRRKQNRKLREKEDKQRLRAGEVSQQELRREKRQRRKQEEKDQLRAAWKREMREKLERRMQKR